MGKTVTVHEAKTHLSRLIRDCVAGEEIVICRRDEPVARLVPVEGTRPPRRLGLHCGLIEMAPDFDEPLDDFAEYS